LIPVDQEFTNSAPGDCVRACVASLLELPLAHVPNFASAPGDDQGPLIDALQEFLAPRGLYYAETAVRAADLPDIAAQYLHGHHLLIGQTPSGGRHCVVGRAGEQVHDPHPLRRGVLPIAGDYFVVGLICHG